MTVGVGQEAVLKCLTKNIHRVSWYIDEKSDDNKIAAYSPWEKEKYTYHKRLVNNNGTPRAKVDLQTGSLTIYSVRTSPLSDEHLYICEGHMGDSSVFLHIIPG